MIDSKTGRYVKDPTKKVKKKSGKIKNNNAFDPNTATNKQKGNWGEMKTDEHFEKLTTIGDNKNVKLTALHDKVGSIDDKLKKGIDGIFENANPPPNFVIVESKYGSATLGNTKKNGKQMSDKWCRHNIKKMFKDNPKKREEILKDLRNGETHKVLSKVDELGNITTKKINSAGNIGNNWF